MNTASKMIIYLSKESVQVLGKEDPDSWMDQFAFHRGYDHLGYSKINIGYNHCEKTVYRGLLNGLSMYAFGDYFSQEYMNEYHLRLTEDLAHVVKIMEVSLHNGEFSRDF